MELHLMRKLCRGLLWKMMKKSTKMKETSHQARILTKKRKMTKQVSLKGIGLRWGGCPWKSGHEILLFPPSPPFRSSLPYRLRFPTLPGHVLPCYIANPICPGLSRLLDVDRNLTVRMCVHPTRSLDYCFPSKVLEGALCSIRDMMCEDVYRTKKGLLHGVFEGAFLVLGNLMWSI
jgi:hypothetical protein